ncbi:hypothetical protein G7Y79_00027g060840 [Physcia stellaris]|nr:hypothetical protein G7Y79_00027g060840 [Physcia stellaris]
MMQNPPVLALPSAKPKLTLLTLPAEIRNQIFEYVLIPGAVYIHAPPDGDLPIKETSSIISAPSNHFSLLAVNRSIYEDYATCFYRRNTFYFPEGPVGYAYSYYTKLKPEHQRLIQHLGIRLSLADLTPAVLDQMFKPTSSAPLGRPRGQQRDIRTFRLSCLKSLRQIWVPKLMLMDHIHRFGGSTDTEGLRSVRVEGALSKPLLLTGEELKVQLEKVENEEIYEPFHKGGKELKELITTVQGYASGLIEANLARIGEKETIAWMKNLPAWCR